MNNYFIWDCDPVFLDLGILQLRYYSVAIFLGMVAAVYLLRYMYRREGLAEEGITTMAIYMFLGTFIGLRFGHCLFYEPEYYLKYPWEIILPIGRGPDGGIVFYGYNGLASHGGVLGVFIALSIFAYRNKMSLWRVMDKTVIMGVLAGSLVRVGNFFNSEIIGRPTDMPWAVIFKRVDNVPRHPAQLYEAVIYLLIFFLLFYIYRKKYNPAKPGLLVAIAAILVFTARFFVEFYKERQVGFEENLTIDMGQILSIPFVLFGIVFLVYRYIQAKREAA